MEKIAITGASGHVGTVLLRKLLKRTDISINALIHNQDITIQDPRITKIQGDIRNINTVLKLCKDCHTVYHCAAYISIVAYTRKKLHQVNVEGTANILQAVKENNSHLVYISSVEAIGKQHNGTHSEADGFSTDHSLIEYGKSKAIAAISVQKAVQNNEINAVIICPVSITGPFDPGTSKFGTMVKDFLTQKLPARIINAGFSFVDVRDVADAAIAANESGTNGQHYIVSSEYKDMETILQNLSTHTGLPLPKMKLSISLLKFLAIFIEAYSFCLRKEPIFSTGSARIIESKLRVTNNLLKTHLNINPRPISESLADQIAFYQGKEISL